MKPASEASTRQKKDSKTTRRETKKGKGGTKGLKRKAKEQNEKGPKREAGVEKANMSLTRVGMHEDIINPKRASKKG